MRAQRVDPTMLRTTVRPPEEGEPVAQATELSGIERVTYIREMETSIELDSHHKALRNGNTAPQTEPTSHSTALTNDHLRPSRPRPDLFCLYTHNYNFGTSKVSSALSPSAKAT